MLQLCLLRKRNQRFSLDYISALFALGYIFTYIVIWKTAKSQPALVSLYVTFTVDDSNRFPSTDSIMLTDIWKLLDDREICVYRKCLGKYNRNIYGLINSTKSLCFPTLFQYVQRRLHSMKLLMGMRKLSSRPRPFTIPIVIL